MPTADGRETIGERLVKRRAELVRVEESIAREETSGQGRNVGGQQITEIAYERLLERRTALRDEIRGLEARIDGSAAAARGIILQTRMP